MKLSILWRKCKLFKQFIFVCLCNAGSGITGNPYHAVFGNEIMAAALQLQAGQKALQIPFHPCNQPRGLLIKAKQNSRSIFTGECADIIILSVYFHPFRVNFLWIGDNIRKLAPDRRIFPIYFTKLAGMARCLQNPIFIQQRNTA